MALEAGPPHRIRAAHSSTAESYGWRWRPSPARMLIAVVGCAFGLVSSRSRLRACVHADGLMQDPRYYWSDWIAAQLGQGLASSQPIKRWSGWASSRRQAKFRLCSPWRQKPAHFISFPPYQDMVWRQTRACSANIHSARECWLGGGNTPSQVPKLSVDVC